MLQKTKAHKEQISRKENVPSFGNRINMSSLKISDPNDSHEAEADRVADKVMMMPSSGKQKVNMKQDIQPGMSVNEADTNFQMQLEEGEQTDDLRMTPEIRKTGVAGAPEDSQEDSDDESFQLAPKYEVANGNGISPMIQKEPNIISLSSDNK